MNQKCKLCNQEKEIVQSHIVPKFVVRFLKETGPGFFRTFENPNIKHQDIAKLPLLCRDCEVMLSREEDYFNREIFHPLLKDQWTSISYSESLYFFLISVLWRNLVSKFEEYKKGLKHFREILARTERAWRIYLSNRENDPQTDVHLFITDILTDSIPVRRFNSYLTRAVDITIASSQKDCFVYTKFARFCIFAPLTNYDHTLWVNTKVMNGKGILSGIYVTRDSNQWPFFLPNLNPAEANSDFFQGFSQFISGERLFDQT